MKTCFISAPVNVDLSELRKLLLTKHVKTLLPFELPITGRDFQEQISTAIRKADFCLGLVLTGRQSANVFFELGVASALRKPVVLLQDTPTSLPANVSGLPVSQYDAPDFVGLSFFLDQFLSRSVQKRRDKPPPPRKTKRISMRASQLTSHVESLGGRATHDELVNVLEVALKDSGIRVSAEPKHGNRIYDFAVWVDELDIVIGNPLLIELKTSLTSDQAARIRADFVAASPTSIGRALVVVYGSGPERLQHESSGAPLILFVSLREFLTALRRCSFGDFIRTERNRLVHGVA